MDEVKETMNHEALAQEVTDPTLSPQVPPAPAAEVPDAPARDEWGTVRGLALKQLHRFMAFEPRVLRGDDPDAIHDMRVASRRLQQILDLLYPKPRPNEIRGLRRKIRRSRRCLSDVRNCDVLFQRVEKILGRKRTSRREVWMAVGYFLRERRAQSFDKALGKLGKLNLAVFYTHLKRHLEPGEGNARPAPHGTPGEELRPQQFYERVGEALDRVWRRFESQLALSHSDPRAPVIHGARISTKRLRYLIEVIAEFGVSGSAEELAWLRRLQQHLGDWHDMEVLEQMMIRMVARPEFLRDHLELAMGVEKLIARNRALKEKFKTDYFRMTLDSPDVERLKDWVGYLLASPSTAFATA